MIRGTTPTHTFYVPIDLTSATVLYLTYKQNNQVVIERDKDHITIQNDRIICELTQTETLMFNIRDNIRVQIRAGFSDGSRIASSILVLSPAGEILKDGEI